MTDLRGARLFIGTTDTGNIAEHAVREFLVSLLPAKYSVGVGEVINAEGTILDRIDQSQQKDVIIYDQYINTILGWGSSKTSLFPVESVYGVLEVKTSISSQAALDKAVEQAVEVKKLCNRSSPPFVGVFVFESQINEDTLFESLASKEPKERADFVMILKSNSHPDSSCYLTHWNYGASMNGGVPVRFVSAAETSAERDSKSSPPMSNLLTLACTKDALLWFYLFLLEQLDDIKLTKPNLLDYVDGETRETLGHCRDESEYGWR
jgi:hypothetical protein